MVNLGRQPPTSSETVNHPSAEIQMSTGSELLGGTICYNNCNGPREMQSSVVPAPQAAGLVAMQAVWDLLQHIIQDIPALLTSRRMVSWDWRRCREVTARSVS